MDLSPGAVLECWEGDRYQVLAAGRVLDRGKAALYSVRARVLPSEWTRVIGADPDPPGTERTIPIIVDGSGATFRPVGRSFPGTVRTPADVAAVVWHDLETGTRPVMIDGWPETDNRRRESGAIARFRAPGTW